MAVLVTVSSATWALRDSSINGIGLVRKVIVASNRIVVMASPWMAGG